MIMLSSYSTAWLTLTATVGQLQQSDIPHQEPAMITNISRYSGTSLYKRLPMGQKSVAVLESWLMGIQGFMGGGSYVGYPYPPPPPNKQ